MLQVYLVRHGETEWNAARRIQGQSDSPLTAKGIFQAQQVAERMRHEGITHVISSDLGRTRHTAEIIADVCGCEVVTEPRLRELHMGILESRDIDSLNTEEERWRKQMVDGMDKLTGISEVKRKGGAIGIFSAGKLSRTSVYHQALILALAPFHNAVYQLRPQTH